MTTLLRSLVISIIMTAMVLEEGWRGAYDAAIIGVYFADCLLIGHLLGWVLLRIPAGRYCLDLVFWRLVLERRPID